jgi:hypothetical protein
MKMEQNIVAGGINRTSTPILKLRMKRELAALFKAARHIEHCASAPVFANNTTMTAATAKTSNRNQLDRISTPPTAVAQLAAAP